MKHNYLCFLFVNGSIIHWIVDTLQTSNWAQPILRDKFFLLLFAIFRLGMQWLDKLILSQVFRYQFYLALFLRP